mmetsp:Transcript_73755/g.123190  ORF Transcript_73755/g.123190 Transcript_73755/m.123190 type:complete len:443 (+) Transcript_73755:286-1614(+)
MSCNPVDKAIFAAGNIEQNIEDCARGCWGRRSCVTQCIAGRGLSESCAGCVGEVTGCNVQYCYWECIGGASSQCMTCSETRCMTAFSQCSGLDIPQPSSPLALPMLPPQHQPDSMSPLLPPCPRLCPTSLSSLSPSSPLPSASPAPPPLPPPLPPLSAPSSSPPSPPLSPPPLPFLSATPSSSPSLPPSTPPSSPPSPPPSVPPSSPPSLPPVNRPSSARPSWLACSPPAHPPPAILPRIFRLPNSSPLPARQPTSAFLPQSQPPTLPLSLPRLSLPSVPPFVKGGPLRVALAPSLPSPTLAHLPPLPPRSQSVHPINSSSILSVPSPTLPASLAPATPPTVQAKRPPLLLERHNIFSSSTAEELSSSPPLPQSLLSRNPVLLGGLIVAINAFVIGVTLCSALYWLRRKHRAWPRCRLHNVNEGGSNVARNVDLIIEYVERI